MNPLKHELILYLILLAAFSPLLYIWLFCPLSTPSSICLSLLPLLPVLYFFPPLLEVSVSKSFRWEAEAVKDEASGPDSVNVSEKAKCESAGCVGCPSFFLIFFRENLRQLRSDFSACQKSSLLVLFPTEWQRNSKKRRSCKSSCRWA